MIFKTIDRFVSFEQELFVLKSTDQSLIGPTRGTTTRLTATDQNMYRKYLFKQT